MWRGFYHLLKKDFKLMLSSKFFLLALISLILYSCYINFVYVNLDQEMYPVYLYDPQGKVSVNSQYLTRVDSREALETACAFCDYRAICRFHGNYRQRPEIVEAKGV